MTIYKAKDILRLNRALANFNPTTGEEIPMNQDCKNFVEAIDTIENYIFHLEDTITNLQEHCARITKCQFCVSCNMNCSYNIWVRSFPNELPSDISPIAGFYRHYKGKYYYVTNEIKNPETHESYVLYHSLNNIQDYIRSHENFFSTVLVDGKEVPRFSKVQPNEIKDI